MRIRLALACTMALLLQACLPAGSSVWAVDAGYSPYPYGRFERSPHYGMRPAFPYRHPHRCMRDRWGRVWC